MLACEACGWTAGCERCTARMVLHSAEAGRKRTTAGCAATIAARKAPIPRACPTCGNVDLKAMGRGTQRVEETLAARFPGARIVRIDRDSARRRAELSRTLEGIRRGEGDILVGTQLLAKGHDFPALTLVGVLNADSALVSTDYRAPERLFAVLAQVAGRAGRRERPGEVLIQTRYPRHPLFAALERHDFAGFAQSQLAERRAAGFPPFVFEAALRAEAPKLETALAFLRDAAASVQAPEEVQVFDPVPHLLTRRADFERAQLVMQSALAPGPAGVSEATERRAVRESPRARCAGISTSTRSSSIRIPVFSMTSDPKGRLADAYRKALAKEAPEHADVEVVFEKPRQPEHGDFACSIALQLAKRLKRNPRQLAEALTSAAIAAYPEFKSDFLGYEIAGPGFINFRLKPGAQARTRSASLFKPAGASVRARRSPNRCRSSSFPPIRPVRCTSATVGRRRSATRSPRCIESQGDKVTREFYYNDAGAQIQNLALSVQARARGLKPGDAGLAAGRLRRRIHRGDRQRLPRQPRRSGSHPHIRGGLPAQGAGHRPARVRRQVRRLLPRIEPLHRRQGGRGGEGPARERQDLREGRRAVAAHHGLRRRQGSRGAQVRRHLHLLRAGRGLPPHQVAPRLHAR